jgi:hypothetical protein
MEGVNLLSSNRNLLKKRCEVVTKNSGMKAVIEKDGRRVRSNI